MLWAFMSQILRDGKEASCQSAVARVVAYLTSRRRAATDCDTGNYCRARAKLPEAALKELAVQCRRRRGIARYAAVVVQGANSRQARRRLYVQDARSTRQPKCVPTTLCAETRPGFSERSRNDNLIARDMLFIGCSNRSI